MASRPDDAQEQAIDEESAMELPERNAMSIIDPNPLISMPLVKGDPLVSIPPKPEDAT
jgi:hypothetical protein